jgi:hypothetical protein
VDNARETPPTAPDDAPQIVRLSPAAPQGGEAAIAATVTIGGEQFPMVVRQGTPPDTGWAVSFGDLADEGRYATFEEALRVAHERVARDAAELARSLRDGGY